MLPIYNIRKTTKPKEADTKAELKYLNKVINVNRARTISAYNPEKHHTDTNDFASILKKKYGKSIAVNEEVSLLKPAMGLVINNHKMSGYV